MALVTVQNLTNSILSTDVGSLQPAETKSLTMGPDQAYRASEGLKALSDAGRVLVTISEESAKLDALEPAAVGTASVADGAVTTAKLAALAVTTAKLAATSVTTPKLALLAVDSTILAAAAVTAGKIAAGGISAANQHAAGVVDTAALGASAVTAAKLAFFKSTEQTGTGSSQNVAHGLGSTPGLVMVMPTDILAAEVTIVEGSHDGTNVVLTVTSGAKFKVIAIK